MQPDTKKILRTAIVILGTGLISVLIIFTLLGGIGRPGPHTNLGWLFLMLAMGCLPTGSLTMLLAILKVINDYRRQPR